MILAQLLDQAADLNHLSRVQAHGGLIQDDDLRTAQQCSGQAHALTVALGQVLDQPVLHLRKTGAVHGLLHLGGAVGLLYLFQLGHEHQILPGSHIHIQGRLLGQIAHTCLRRAGLLQNVVSVDGHGAAGGGKITGQNIHRGGFARAVGAQQSIYDTLLHFKRDVIHRKMAAITLGEMLHLNQKSHTPFVPPPGWTTAAT